MRFVVLGGGRVGISCVHDLLRLGSEVTLIDKKDERIEAVKDRYDVHKVLKADASKPQLIRDHLSEADCCIAAIPPDNYPELTQLAIETGTDWVDLGGDKHVLEKQLKVSDMAKDAAVSVVPNCGLAPGIVNIFAIHGANQFEDISSISIQVGGLPQEPEPPLDYSLNFSVEGLLTEYSGKTEIIDEGNRKSADSLSGLEMVEIDDIGELEAFYTSGVLGHLLDYFDGKISSLEYKTLRYPGHRDKIKLLQDLGLLGEQPVPLNGNKLSPRKLTASLFERELPSEEPDVVAGKVEVRRKKDSEKLVYMVRDRYDDASGLSAMSRCSGFPAVITARMAVDSELETGSTSSEYGVVPAERCVPFEKFVDRLCDRGVSVEIREEHWSDS